MYALKFQRNFKAIYFNNNKKKQIRIKEYRLTMQEVVPIVTLCFIANKSFIYFYWKFFIISNKLHSIYQQFNYIILQVIIYFF
jgi:hypothetical protein